MKLSTAVEGYLLFKSSRCSPETIRTDTSNLHQFVEWYGGENSVGQIEAEDVRAFLEHHRARGLSPFTIRRHLAILSGLFKWLGEADVGLLQENPAAGIQAPRLPKVKPKALAQEDVEALLLAADKAKAKRRARALLLFLLDTGCRASELCGVEMGDVDLRTGKVLVTGKGSKQRFVYLGKRARSAVWLYVKDERPEPARVDSEHLFLTVRGYPLSRHTLKDIVKRLAARVGLRSKVSPHRFRHTAAINHLRNGMDLVSLQHLLGHASVVTTRGYLEALRDEDVEQKARRTSPSDNWRL